MPTVYEIRVGGILDLSWSEWLDGVTVTQLESGETLLSGQFVDQAALHGLLNRIHDLNLKLICMEKKEEF